MRLISALLALLLLSSTCFAQTWTINAAPMGGYLADFPGKPEVQQSNDGVRNGKPLITYLQSVQVGSAIFLGVSATDMGAPPGSEAERAAILDSVRNSILGSGGRKVVSMKAIKLGGVPGFDMIYDSPEHKVRLRHRIFISGNRLIQQMASGPVGVESNADTVRFMNSLRLQP
jgi:hypothetical protein